MSIVNISFAFPPYRPAAGVSGLSIVLVLFLCGWRMTESRCLAQAFIYIGFLCMCVPVSMCVILIIFYC